MKTLTFILVLTVFIISITGYLIRIDPSPTVDTKALPSTGRVHMQKLVLPLFENVCEVSADPIIQRLALEFKPNVEEYTKAEVITNLSDINSTGLLPKGEIFSEYNPDHMNELKIIYEVLYYAKNFDTFYKTAAWVRQNVNCGLYVNAIYLAALNRKDMENIIIPAPYELLPNYFIRKDVLSKAVSLLSGEEITSSESVHDEGNGYIIDANYTSNFFDNDDESKLAYFREDIGLNSFYLFRKLKLAPWLNQDVNSSYGEAMYQTMKQLMARYNLERYANGLSEIDSIDWKSLVDAPYDPMLIYSDGSGFSHRASQIAFNDNADIILLQTIEDTITTVVNHMILKGYNKTQILNYILEILVTTDRSYETLAYQLLGKDLNSNNGHTSVLEHYMTSLRDPMFWKINKKIVHLISSALELLPPYSKNELYFPGVQIMNIDIKKAMTVYDYFDFDVTEALKPNNTKSNLKVKIGQPRLNHKPFTVKLNISSLVTSKGLVKVYFGPKLLPSELVEKKDLFTLYDMFEINLKKGTNIISRLSDDSRYLSPDFVSFPTIRQNVEDAEFGLDSLPLITIDEQTGYPSRLVLPKGTANGLPIQMFVFVAPFYKSNLIGLYANSMEFNSALLSPAYPLDLAIHDSKLVFGLPNSMTKYITLTHKGDNKIENYGGPGVTKKWYTVNTYDQSSRPTYPGNSAKTFDYTSKKGQYSNKEDLSTGQNEHDVDQDVITSEEYKGLDYHLYAPRLLSSSQFDYTSKFKKEPFDYKAKKAQFNKGGYTYKKEDYSKYRTITTAEQTTTIKNSEFIDNEDLIESDTENTLEVNYYSQKGQLDNEEVILANDEENNSNKSSEEDKRVFASSDYSKTEKKELFNYKNNKSQFNNIYNSSTQKLNKNGITESIAPLKSNKLIDNTNISGTDNKKNLELDNELDLNTPKPGNYINDYGAAKHTDHVQPPATVTQHTPSVLELLIHGFDSDYNDIKLYE